MERDFGCSKGLICLGERRTQQERHAVASTCSEDSGGVETRFSGKLEHYRLFIVLSWMECAILFVGYPVVSRARGDGRTDRH